MSYYMNNEEAQKAGEEMLKAVNGRCGKWVLCVYETSCRVKQILSNGEFGIMISSYGPNSFSADITAGLSDFFTGRVIGKTPLEAYEEIIETITEMKKNADRTARNMRKLLNNGSCL